LTLALYQTATEEDDEALGAAIHSLPSQSLSPSCRCHADRGRAIVLGYAIEGQYDDVVVLGSDAIVETGEGELASGCMVKSRRAERFWIETTTTTRPPIFLFLRSQLISQTDDEKRSRRPEVVQILETQ
jgi:hypothetical protein